MMYSSGSKRSRRGTVYTPIAIAAGLGLLLTGCDVANTNQAAKDSSALRVVLPLEPTTLEACDATLASTGVVIRSNVTEPLIERDPSTGELLPKLATKWETAGDNNWTLTLREGVKFQNGTTFDAAAAAKAIDRAVNSKLGCDVEGQIFGDPDLTLTVVNSTTLTVTTVKPDPVLPLRLSFIEVSAPSDPSAKERAPIGTGPYKITGWDAGTKITLDRNPDYWGDAPTYEDVEYQWRSEGTVRAAMVTGGEADIAMSLSAQDGAGDLGVDYPNNETVALRFSGNIAPLNDIRVRQAINYAIDKKGITESLYNGSSLPASQIIPEGVIGYNPDLQPWEFNLAKARKLVAEAKADGVPTDQKITIVARNDQFPKISEMIQVLQEQLSQAGLNVEVNLAETSVGLQYQVRPFVLDKGAIAMLIQHGNQAGDASFSTDSYMTSEAAMSQFGTADFDAILKEASTKQGEERQKAFAGALAYERDNIVQFAYIASMTGVIAIAPTTHYTPNSATGDELRVAEIKPAS